MPKIFIVRHTQTEWNKKKIFTGWRDVSLSKEGIEQAKEIKEILKDEKIDIVISSPMKRCIETYKIIMSERENYDVIYNYYIIERRYGILEGKSKEQVKKGNPFVYQYVFHRGYFEGPPLGESFKDVEDRILLFFDWLNNFLKENNNKNILICAHGNSIRLMLKILDNLNIEETSKIEISQGKPYIYEYYFENDKIKFKKLSDTI
jgi:2,3-bisphosphoglycerate-dependent phosphoglycerate mutase